MSSFGLRVSGPICAAPLCLAAMVLLTRHALHDILPTPAGTCELKRDVIKTDVCF